MTNKKDKHNLSIQKANNEWELIKMANLKVGLNNEAHDIQVKYNLQK